MIIPKTYLLLDRCIEDGINYGYQRAFKHTDTPDETWIKTQIYQAVMNEISEWFEIKGVEDGNSTQRYE
jgi:hypothetical protein